MDRPTLKFGDFITQKRIDKDISLRKMAKLVGYSAPYWSDVEKNRKNPPGLDRLETIANILCLTVEDKNTMLDLAGDGRETVAPDIIAYIKENDYVATALRIARDLGADQTDWEKFVAELKIREETCTSTIKGTD